MKKLKLIIASILLIMYTTSSCNFLDVQDHYEEMMPYDSVFHNTRNLQRYLWTIPTWFPDEGALIGTNAPGMYTPGVLSTDEGITGFGSGEYQGIGFSIGEITPTNLKSFNNWDSMYKVIRRVNILFSRMDEAEDLTPTNRSEILSYGKFMRAYAYYHLLMNFGPLILVGDEVLNNNEDAAYYDAHRATYDETVNYICEQLEEAANYMPLTIPLTQFGRPTRGAAYGLIARLRLQQASPLYNGGDAAKRYFGSWKRSVDGVHYVSQTYDEKKWAVAAAAAERVIKMDMYKLYTEDADSQTPSLPSNVPNAKFPDGAGGIDPFKSYSGIFTGEVIAQTNPEYVWGRVSAGVKSYLRHTFPVNLGGYNGIALSMKMVDAHRMRDGRTINNASLEYPYIIDQKHDGEAEQFSGYYLPKGVWGTYANREMRFYANVGFSGRFWTCSSTTESQYKNVVVKYDYSGNSGMTSTGNTSERFLLTGFTITKFTHESDAFQGAGNMQQEKYYGIIRYAEILLAYTEAMNNLTQSHTIPLPVGVNEIESFTVSRDKDKMAKSFNQVRFRAGLPGLAQTELSDPEEIQKVLEQELMVEFLFENRRYFDVRRWGIYDEVESVPMMGLTSSAPEPGFYTTAVVNHRYTRERVVNRKMIFLPLPKYELNKVKSLDQNPGWD